jgi:hypothetical protein
MDCETSERMTHQQWTIVNRQSEMGWFARLTIVILLAICAAAQQPQPTPAQPQPQSAAPKAAERRISPEEAKQLLGAVDQVLKFDSQNTGLPIKAEVKRQLIDRDQVQAYIEKQLREDEDAQRLKNGEVVLKKFGLLPRDFSVDTFLVQLMREQVAGYYDPQTKFVNLLNWLPPETQMPVLAHELTHALQDQNFGMEKWVRGPNHKKKMSPAETIADDESTVARHAILEGQAMAVMIDWMLAPVGKSLLDAPLIVDAMEAGMSQGGDSPVFNRSPLYLQRVLIFPYTYGLDFERALLKQGKDAAFAGIFQRPPQNTREVMEPAVYLAGEQLPPLGPPDIASLISEKHKSPEIKGVPSSKDEEWELYDAGSIGEFDVSVIAEQFSDAATAKKMYPNWRGGYYYAVKKKGAAVQQPGDLGLVFVTRWANAEAAEQFRKLWDSYVVPRYHAPADMRPAPVPGYSGQSWPVAPEPVSVVSRGDLVIAIESIRYEMHEKIRSAVLKQTPPTASNP